MRRRPPIDDADRRLRLTTTTAILDYESDHDHDNEYVGMGRGGHRGPPLRLDAVPPSRRPPAYIMKPLTVKKSTAAISADDGTVITHAAAMRIISERFTSSCR